MCGQSICPDAVIYLEPKTRGVAAPAWFAYCLADGGLLGLNLGAFVSVA